LLENLLVDYAGTLLIVSHDRDFLDNVVTSTLVFEGDGKIGEYIGGYADWVRQRAIVRALKKEGAGAPVAKTQAAPKPGKARKLNQKEQRELQGLPAQIEVLEKEQAELARKLADANFYQREPAAVSAAKSRLQEIERDLAAGFARWEELEQAANASRGSADDAVSRV
jgi:ATP-binding cassette subfamily F protein uup